MGWNFIVNNYDDYHDKQFRISIDPYYLTKQENVAKVTKILTDVFKDSMVAVKIISLENSDEIRDCWDGTTKTQETDRDQRGKEVCVYLPKTSDLGDELQQEQITALMLKAWSGLQQANIPLLTFSPPGDRAILMDGYPTPFSYTFDEPGEWHKRNGILFKDCESNNDHTEPQHPLHKIHFTFSDIKKYQLNFDKALVREQHCTYLKNHFESAAKEFSTAIDNLLGQDKSFVEIDIDTIFSEILKIKTAYEEERETINTIADEEQLYSKRGEAQNTAYAAMDAIEDMALFTAAFPREATSNLGYFPALGALINHQILNQDTDGIVKIRDTLKEVMKQECQSLMNDFEYFDERITLLESLQTKLLTNLKTLLAKNPFELQKMFRHYVFICKEANYYLRASLGIQPLNDHVKCQTAISNYLKDRPATLGFFSRYFDNARGLKRAEAFSDLFNQYSENEPVLDLLIYSLLASKNGKELKSHLAQELGFTSTKEALEAYDKKLRDLVNSREEDHLFQRLNDGVIAPIVKATNIHKRFDDPAIRSAIETFQIIIRQDRPAEEDENRIELN